jgi:hypothetical protein
MYSRWSKTQAAAKKIDEFQIRTFVIHHSSFVFWLLHSFAAPMAIWAAGEFELQQ